MKDFGFDVTNWTFECGGYICAHAVGGHCLAFGKLLSAAKKRTH